MMNLIIKKDIFISICQVIIILIICAVIIIFTSPIWIFLFIICIIPKLLWEGLCWLWNGTVEFEEFDNVDDTYEPPKKGIAFDEVDD